MEAPFKAAKQEMKIESNAESRIKATFSKAVENFWAYDRFLDEMADLTFDAYNKGIMSALNKIAVQYPELDLDFLDKFLELKEDKVVADTSTQYAPAAIP